MRVCWFWIDIAMGLLKLGRCCGLVILVYCRLLLMALKVSYDWVIQA